MCICEHIEHICGFLIFDSNSSLQKLKRKCSWLYIDGTWHKHTHTQTQNPYRQNRRMIKGEDVGEWRETVWVISLALVHLKDNIRLNHITQIRSASLYEFRWHWILGCDQSIQFIISECNKFAICSRHTTTTTKHLSNIPIWLFGTFFFLFISLSLTLGRTFRRKQMSRFTDHLRFVCIRNILYFVDSL